MPSTAIPKDVQVNEPQTAGWLTRAQAVSLMDVSMQTLVNYERRGMLHPGYATSPHNGRVIIVYDPDELAKVVIKRNRQAGVGIHLGERTARAFELFDEGRSLSEVVIVLREEFVRVRELHEQWLDGGGANRTINEAAYQELAKLVGEFGPVTELIERVRALARKEEQTCANPT